MNWDLTALFKDEDTLKVSVETLAKSCNEFKNKYKDNLLNLNSEQFLSAINEYENLLSKISKIMTYAFLVFAKDTKNGSFYAKYEQICSKLQSELLFFELEFNSLSDDKQSEFIKSTPKFEYYLSNLKEQKTHQLSLQEEQVLLRKASTGAEGFSRLFDETMAALKFDFDGKKISEEEILSLFYSTDRDVRKRAAEVFSEELKRHQHLLCYIYNMIKTDLAVNCELRGYEYAESGRHQSNQISKKSVDALINTCEKNFDISQDYYTKKREILGYSELYDYDRYAPLDNSTDEFNFDECKKIILKAFSEFSPQFGELAEQAFNNGWIDAYPNDGKRGGAFSHSGSSDAHPYILLNHTNRRRDLFTLAHELGHAIHQKLSYSVGYLNSDTPLTTAETASVFCEMLVFDYIKQGLEPKERQGLLAGKIEDIFATLFRQINFTTFEQEVHNFEGEISQDKLNEIWLKHSKKMFGESIILNDYYKIWWSYIPHFIHSPFYCYAYSYAQLLVLALFGLYKSKKIDNFSEIYTKFLSAGGSKSPKDLVRMFGFDIDDENFWLIGLNQVRELVGEFKEIN